MADGRVVINTELDQSGAKQGMSSLGKSLTKTGAIVGKGFGAAFAGATAIVGATTTAVAGLTTATVSAYAEFEQLTGGVETLFGNSASKVREYADNAYKSAGMSANKYMETVTSFSASLLQSVGGDTEKASTLANDAVIAMSDNANKMGTSMESIQNAYQGFAKGNYTMLDNLKLGFGGTKEEMQRLLEEASKLSGVQYDISSFADVTQAIQVIQTEMGISGTTALEASTTISGSLAMVKSSWENLLTGIASGESISGLIDNLVQSISTFAQNIIPVIAQSFMGIASLVQELLPVAFEQIPNILTNVLPKLLQAGIDIVNTIILGIQQNLPTMITSGIEMLMTFVTSILSMLPMILDTGLKMIIALATGIAEALPTLLPQIVQTLVNLVNTLIANIPMFIEAGIKLILGLVTGLLKAIPVLIKALPQIISSLLNAIIEAVPLLIEGIISLVSMIVQALPEILISLVEAIPLIIESLLTAIIELLPVILEGLISLVMMIVENIPTIILALVEAIPTIIQTLLNAIVTFIPLIIQTGIDLFLSLVKALPTIITGLLEAIPVIIEAIIMGIIELIPMIIQAGIDLFIALITDLPTIIVEIVKAVPEIIKGLISAFGSFYKSMAEVGMNLLKGIWNGMNNAAGWLKDKVISLCGGVVDGIKDFFGIHSPSALMRDEIGKYIAQGIGVGFEENDPMKQIISDMKNGMESLKTTLNTDLSANMGKLGLMTEFSQVNNFYTPVASPDEVSRTLRLDARTPAFGGLY